MTWFIAKEDLTFDTDLIKAAQMIKEGKTVIFPTETVYGLGANALDQDAALKIYKAKGRPSDNPLIVHITRYEQLDVLVARQTDQAKRLIHAFWPGPLTLVFEKNEAVPKGVTGGLDTVAIRMPAHPVAHALIEAAGVPVAAPSANLSGQPSPTRAQHVIRDMANRVDVIITDGDVFHGIESTVLDVTGDVPVILRPGSVTKEMIESLVGQVLVDPSLLVKLGQVAPKSPGMKYKHYAPLADVYVVEEGTPLETMATLKGRFQDQGKKVLMVVCGNPHESREDVLVFDDATSLGQSLFDVLRQADDKGYDVVLFRAVPLEGVGLAVMNRLIKAADHKIIKA